MPLPYRLPLLAALALLPFVGRAASAPCPQAETIIEHAYPRAVSGADGSYIFEGARITPPPDDKVNSDPRDLICKVWPIHPELTLAAVPLMHHGDGDDPDMGDLDVLVLDTRTLSVRHRLRLPGVIEEDATPTSELSFDTARYRLSATTTAFGLRVSVDHGSNVGSITETDLLLLAVINGKLRLVLPNYTVAMSNENDYPSPSGSARCTSDSVTSSVVLNMAPTVHTGFADIEATEQGTKANAKATIDSPPGCPKLSNQDIGTKTRLTFDGQIYRDPHDPNPRPYIPYIEK